MIFLLVIALLIERVYSWRSLYSPQRLASVLLQSVESQSPSPSRQSPYRHRHTPFLTRLRAATSTINISQEKKKNFSRQNPFSDKIAAKNFHHVEFYCGDATSTFHRFRHSLGLEFLAKSDYSTGNTLHASYLGQSGDMRMVFTAPYNVQSQATLPTDWEGNEGKYINHSTLTYPEFNTTLANEFFQQHGLAVRAIGIEVEDVAAVYQTILANGGQSALHPTRIHDQLSRAHELKGYVEVAEVYLYGNVVLRLLDRKHYQGEFLPNFQEMPRPASVPTKKVGKYGLDRFDHIVGNVWHLQKTADYIKIITVSQRY